MITVKEALKLVKDETNTSGRIRAISVANASKHILSQDIYAPIAIPPFRQSSMDGFAIRFDESEQTNFHITNEIKAGDSGNCRMQPGDAVRIFTGAPVPEDADAVVIQEKATVEGSKLTIAESPTEGQNIRPFGGLLAKDSLALAEGHFITPASVSLLMSLGIEKVQVYKAPKVAIIITGNELVSTGGPLENGQLYESNGTTLKAALYQQGIEEVSNFYAKDTLEETEAVLDKALETSDIVIISGGISVGDYDFVGPALRNLRVEQLFYKVHQKPGKPLYFGKKDEKLVFALPGNPASTLTCFYVYVTLLIDLWRGSENPGLLRIQYPISEAFEKTIGRALFLKARIKDGKVVILNQQNSATVISFAIANALVFIPGNVEKVAKHELVETLVLPYGSSN
ncbi:MAG: molybdopterin molybdotransferase MoeA [Flavobacteriaceae bacterium]|nr:molybdopterin molybdotransferase MoeA [Flavobacteriaceae bacterium]